MRVNDDSYYYSPCEDELRQGYEWNDGFIEGNQDCEYPVAVYENLQEWGTYELFRHVLEGAHYDVLKAVDILDRLEMKDQPQFERIIAAVATAVSESIAPESLDRQRWEDFFKGFEL